MRNFDELVEALGLDVTPNQRVAAHQLEIRGLIFTIDFGLSDCIDKLFDLIEEEGGTGNGEVAREEGPAQLPE